MSVSDSESMASLRTISDSSDSYTPSLFALDSDSGCDERHNIRWSRPDSTTHAKFHAERELIVRSICDLRARLRCTPTSHNFLTSSWQRFSTTLSLVVTNWSAMVQPSVLSHAGSPRSMFADVGARSHFPQQHSGASSSSIAPKRSQALLHAR